MLDMLWWLIVGHFVSDFALQSDAMARLKNPVLTDRPDNMIVPGWFTWMFAHSIIHGGCVAAITGQVLLGVGESAIHFLIDYTKCNGLINSQQDQAAHIASKIIWLLIYWLA